APDLHLPRSPRALAAVAPGPHAARQHPELPATGAPRPALLPVHRQPDLPPHDHRRSGDEAALSPALDPRAVGPGGRADPAAPTRRQRAREPAPPPARGAGHAAAGGVQPAARLGAPDGALSADAAAPGVAAATPGTRGMAARRAGLAAPRRAERGV